MIRWGGSLGPSLSLLPSNSHGGSIYRRQNAPSPLPEPDFDFDFGQGPPALYAAYVSRFVLLYDLALQSLPVTVRLLDYYLIWKKENGPPRGCYHAQAMLLFGNETFFTEE